MNFETLYASLSWLLLYNIQIHSTHQFDLIWKSKLENYQIARDDMLLVDVVAPTNTSTTLLSWKLALRGQFWLWPIQYRALPSLYRVCNVTIPYLQISQLLFVQLEAMSFSKQLLTSRVARFPSNQAGRQQLRFQSPSFVSRTKSAGQSDSMLCADEL